MFSTARMQHTSEKLNNIVGQSGKPTAIISLRNISFCIRITRMTLRNLPHNSFKKLCKMEYVK